MRWADQNRSWLRSGLGILLWLGMAAFALAQTETSAPAETFVKPAANAKHAASGRATTKRTSAKKGSKSSRGKKSSKKRGQQAIDATRARQIQTALIREHYLQGEPSGAWDSASQAAMQKYQADQGWQSKQIPDSRALIKLGLGPSHDHLLNPESAMTTSSAQTAVDPKAAAKHVPAEDTTPKN